MSNYLRVLTLLIISLCFSGTEIFSQEQEPGYSVTTTGIAYISDNNLVTAQSMAIADAQRKALIQAAGTIMTFEQVEQQLSSLKRVLFDKAADYIESYKILYDSKRGDRYHITLQSTVNVKKLENYLVVDQSLAPENRLPSVLLMIAQQQPGRDVYTCWWSFIDPETTSTPLDRMLREELQKQGFEVIDHTRMIPQIASAHVYGCLEVKAETLLAMGRQFQADMIIIGSAQAGPAEDRSGEHPAKAVQASIAARAVKTADGSGIVTIETYMPSDDENTDGAYDSALRKAARTFAYEIGEQIALRWTKESKGVLITTLSVSGISSYFDFTKFKNALKKNIPAINAIVQKNVAGKGVLLELESSVDALALAQEMDGRQFDNFTLSITRIAPPQIEAEVSVTAEAVEDEEQEGALEAPHN